MSGQTIHNEMRRHVASRQQLIDNGYILSGNGFIVISGRHGNPGVFALDCEMCDSYGGKKEVVKITIVDHCCKVVYDKVVRPRFQVQNYNTHIHGISQWEINRGVELSEVHNFVERNFYSNTILMGHSLEHDFRALELAHDVVVDVSLVYPHPDRSRKYSLKDLARIHLGKHIQSGTHDSKEDAVTSMELMLKKIGRL